MPNTLTKGATTLTLHPQLTWPDEFAWSAVAARQERGAGGALFLDLGVKLSGRPITLDGRGRAYDTRGLAKALRAWTDDPAAVMTLVYRGTTYTVRWRYDGDNPPMDAEPVHDWADPDDTDYMQITLRLVQVA
jgi:hypothetical protein